MNNDDIYRCLSRVLVVLFAFLSRFRGKKNRKTCACEMRSLEIFTLDFIDKHSMIHLTLSVSAHHSRLDAQTNYCVIAGCKKEKRLLLSLLLLRIWAWRIQQVVIFPSNFSHQLYSSNNSCVLIATDKQLPPGIHVDALINAHSATLVTSPPSCTLLINELNFSLEIATFIALTFHLKRSFFASFFLPRSLD